jgi:hypothetical protein
MSKPHSTPSDVAAEDGEVVVDGPNGFTVSLTPEAAITTSKRLAKAGAEAARQRARREK